MPRYGVLPRRNTLEECETLENGKKIYRERGKLRRFWSQIWNGDVWRPSETLMMARCVATEPKT